MKNTLHVRCLLLTLSLGLLAALQAHGQMKIGDHPTAIHPASILELESHNQAIRLTQGDTLQVNGIIQADTHTDAYQAAEGMLMYNAQDSAVYMRTQGTWRKVVSADEVDSTFWKLTGNNGTDSASSFLGTLDAQPLNIGANGNKYMIIHSDGTINVLGDSLDVHNGAFKVADSIYISKPLTIKDSIVIQSLENALSSDSSVLVIGSGGIVRKMSLDSIGIRTINGVGGTYVHLRFDTVSVGHSGPWIDSVSERGMSSLILNIPNASPSVRGLVSDSTQVFGGMKSFINNVAVGTADTATSTLQVVGTVGTATNLVGSGVGIYDMSTNASGEANYRTIIFDVTSTTGGVTVTLPDASKIAGRLYTFKKVGETNDGQIENPVKIQTSAGQQIEQDSNSYTIYNNFTSITLQAQNNGWYIIR